MGNTYLAAKQSTIHILDAAVALQGSAELDFAHGTCIGAARASSCESISAVRSARRCESLGGLPM